MGGFRRSLTGDSREPIQLLLSNRQIMTGAFGGGPSPFVIDWGRRDVPVAEELLDLLDIDAGAEQKRRRRGS